MKNRFLWGIVLIGFVLIGCKTTKVGGTAECPKKSVDELETVLRNKRTIPFSFFTGKISVDIKDSKQSNSFKTTLRMKPDSAFAGTIKVAGIIGAGFLVDQDTVAFTNKLKKCYKKETFSNLTEMFGANVDYDFLESLVLGQPIGLDYVSDFYPIKDDQYYVLSSHDHKVIDRLEKNNLTDEEQSQIYVRYKLNCGDMSLAQVLVDSPKDGVSVRIVYTQRQFVENFDMPKETNIKILSPEDSTFIKLEYDAPEFNDPDKIRLSIPDSYSECE
ncbi:MAG: DUF4292 domain-containing protein [Crocinitomicaceae bacterium]|nr:DUF4292 domain-containing protein [Crocinitomicaceae bacterium]